MGETNEGDPQEFEQGESERINRCKKQTSFIEIPIHNGSQHLERATTADPFALGKAGTKYLLAKVLVERQEPAATIC